MQAGSMATGASTVVSPERSKTESAPGRRRFLVAASGMLTAARAGGAQATPPASARKGPAQVLRRETLSEPAQAFLAAYKSKLPASEFQLLSRSVETLEANILTPTDDTPGPLPWHPKRGICPSPLVYRGVWSWDAPFHAVGAVRFDPALAREQIQIPLDTQTAAGGLCDVVFETGERVTDFGKPPVLPWAAEVVDRAAPDDAFLKIVYEKSILLESHWRKNRGGDAESLFHFDSANSDPRGRKLDAQLEAGWDNSVRWDEGSYDWWAIDLNCNMIMLYRALAYMAKRLGKAGDEPRWLAGAASLARKVNETLYDEISGVYLDRHRHTGRFSDAVTPASFLPLYVKIASPEQAKRLATLAADPKKFYPSIPSVTFDHPKFNPLDFWRGPTWLNVAYFMLKGLQYYGYNDVASQCRKWLLDTCAGPALWEYYGSHGTCMRRALGAPQYGWTATFAMEFLLNWSPDSLH